MRSPSHIVGSPVILLAALVAMTNAGEVQHTLSPVHGEAPKPLPSFSLASLRPGSQDAHPLLRDTRFMLSGRLRYGFGDLEGTEDSNALTWRHRAATETGEWLGFSALAELEHSWDWLGEDHYNPFPRKYTNSSSSLC